MKKSVKKGVIIGVILVSILILFVSSVSAFNLIGWWSKGIFGQKQVSLSPAFVYGDINQNGIFDRFDFIYLKGILARTRAVPTKNSTAFKAGDVNGDSLLDKKDQSLFLDKLVGRIKKFPVELSVAPAVNQTLPISTKYQAQVYWPYPGSTSLLTAQHLKTVELKGIPSSGCLENGRIKIERMFSNGGRSTPCMDNFFYDPNTDPVNFYLVQTYYFADYLTEYAREKLNMTYLPQIVFYLEDKTDLNTGGGNNNKMNQIMLYPLRNAPPINIVAHEFGHLIQRNVRMHNLGVECQTSFTTIGHLNEAHARYFEAFISNMPNKSGDYDFTSFKTIPFPLPPNDGSCNAGNTQCGGDLMSAIGGTFWDIKNYFVSKYNNTDKANILINRAWEKIDPTYDKEPITGLFTELIDADTKLNNGKNKIALANIFAKRCPACNITISSINVNIPSIFVNHPSCIPAGATCDDSDNGLKYSTKGTASAGTASYTDFCQKVVNGGLRQVDSCDNSDPTCLLDEKYCSAGYPLSVRFRCSNGCREGVCI